MVCQAPTDSGLRNKNSAHRHNGGGRCVIISPVKGGAEHVDRNRSALIMDTEGSLPPVFKILQEALHQNGDVIRVEERRFFLFSQTDSRSTLQYLASLVSEEVERHNAQSPDDLVKITVHSRTKAADENSFEFLRNVMNDRETGSEMRDIVSMITELDRLDSDFAMAVSNFMDVETFEAQGTTVRNFYLKAGKEEAFYGFLSEVYRTYTNKVVHSEEILTILRSHNNSKEMNDLIAFYFKEN